MQLSHEGQIYVHTLCLRSDLPQPDHWEVSVRHFNWHEYREGSPSLELFLVFGENCLHLTTGNNNLASFALSQRNSTPVPLTNNRWTLSPTTGAYFFARSSVSVEHLFSSAPATDDPFRLLRPNAVLWPNQTPAIYSNPLPPTTLSDTHPPPQGLPSSAAVLYQLDLTEMLSPNILLCPALNPYDWMVAYSALTLPHFCTNHLSVLQNPQVLDAFDTKIRQPLLLEQLDAVAAHFIALLPPPSSTFTEQSWILHSKTCKRSASTLPPNDDNIVQDIPSHVAKSPFHLDNIHAAVANLASLLANNADDIPKSPKGWIKVAILPTYACKSAQATSTPTPKKLLAMVFSPWSPTEFRNLSLKTLLPRLWPLITVSVGCVLTSVTLLPDDPNLRNSLFVFPHHLFLILSVVLAGLPAPSPSRISPFSQTTHFPTLFIFVPHRPDRSFCAMVFDLSVNHPVPPLLL